MIRDMGRGIVRLESKKPGERSRLWHHKDSFQVLTENNGTQTIEGLVLNMHMLPAFAPSRNSNTVVLEIKAFTRMPKLSLNEFPVDLTKIESLKVFQADGVPIHQLLTSTPVLDISWASYLPCGLVNLSVRNCNLFDDDFPKNFGSLSSLQKLDVGGNPISSLPDCIRGISGIHELSFSCCTKLKSLVRLPAGVTHLDFAQCTSLEKITYQSRRNLKGWGWGRNDNLVEFEGEFKLESIERVDKEMIDLLSLSKLDPLETIMMDSSEIFGWKGTHPIQGLYEAGIFSTFLPGDKVPGQFSHRSTGSSVSFTVPLVPNLKIRGLNVFSVVAQSNNNDSDPMTNIVNIDGSEFPTITVLSNKSDGRKWIYGPIFFGVPCEGKDVTWLSHWRLGNRLKGGDEVTILIYTKSEFKVKECGIQLVYYDEKDQDKIGSTQHVEDPCFLRAGVRSTIMFYTLKGTQGMFYGSDAWGLYRIGGNIDLIRDINEKSNKEEQERDLILRLAAESGSKSSSNKCGLKVWKGRLIMATVLFLSLPLLARSSLFQQRKKQQPSTSPP
ncbi:hypothetical protein M0R45_010050 [Rubus argutus]|uniref:Uncharacterized protein n=1 Tax=Rubus argutus TaxID=59490 RepID=A0AAW1Y7P2_RUBAR